MSNYWESRAIELENLLQDKTNATIVEVNKLYVNANRIFVDKINKIFSRYQRNGEISSEYALQLLTQKQTAEQRQELLELLSQTTDKTARKKIIAILDAPAYAARIRRIQALSDYVTAQAIKIGAGEQKLVKTRLEDIAKNAYYRTIYNDQKNEGKVYDFEKLSSKRLKATLAHNWSGKHYSERIWNNNDAFVQKLQKAVELGCMTGMSLSEMEDMILEDCIGSDSDKGQRFCASRLIRTEVNYFANQGMLMGYEEAGIERYQFVATLDLKTSEICRSLDLKTFPVSEAEAGVNCPPMHPLCRSVTVPDTGTRTGTRWARDPVTGKGIKVPADITYSQWYEKYVKTVDKQLTNYSKSIKIKPAANSTNYFEKLDFNPNADFKISIDKYPEIVNTGLSNACYKVAKLGSKDDNEHLIVIDLNTGKGVYSETGLNNSVGGSKFWAFLKENRDKTFAFVHNHNTASEFSEGDLRTLLDNNPIDMFVISRPDGKCFVVEKNSTPPTLIFDKLYPTEMNNLSLRVRRGEIDAADRTRIREETLVANLIRDYTKGVYRFG